MSVLLQRYRNIPLGLARPTLWSAFLLAALFLLSFEVAAVGQRVALVIGNSSYKETPLRNPVNDARAMSERLRSLGFDVIALEDAGRDAMQRAILEFSAKLDRETTGLFYYAGHGIQARGRNYLIPIDAKLETESALRYEGIAVTGVLEEMELAHNRVNLVILDACRNNPFERRFRGGSRGLAAIDAARGTMIAYATAPGSVAADGLGQNGLYTEELLRALAEPGLKAEDVFKRVRVAVSDKTDGQQLPWESSSLTGDFIFNVKVEVQTPKRTQTQVNLEALYWETIKDSGNAADFEAYLLKFPEGYFADLAQIRLRQLERESEQQQTAAQAQEEEQKQAKQVAISEELEQFERMKAERERLQQQLVQAQEMAARLADVQRTQSAQQLALAKQQPEPTQQQRLEADIKQAAKAKTRTDAPSPPYKIAIFPTSSTRPESYGEQKDLIRAVTKHIQGNELLDLSYSHVSDSRATVKRTEVWTNSKNPNLEAVMAHAKRLGVQGVVMGSLSRKSIHRYRLKLYLIDVSQDSVIESEGDSDFRASVVQEAFSDFLNERRLESQRTQSAQQLALAKQPEADIEQATKAQPQQGVPSPPYTIAIFPMRNGDASHVARQSVESLTTYIQGNALLALTYSYDSDPSHTVQEAEVWSGTIPNTEAVTAHARKLGVEGVVMGSTKWVGGNSGGLQLTLFVIDINQRKVHHAKGRLDRAASLVFETAFSDFLKGQRVASQTQ